MKKTTAAICFLGIALVATNVWWPYQLLDSGVTLTYQEDSLRVNERALAQSLAVMKALAASPAPRREEVIAAVSAAANDRVDPFEKEGFIWVGDLGLRFSESGHLLEAVPAWSVSP